VDGLTAEEHLRRTDPDFGIVIDALAGRDPGRWWATKPALDPFGSLVRLVLAQQISAAVAATFLTRLQAEVGGELSASRVAALGDASLRSVGLSAGKVRTLRDLSGRVVRGELDLHRFDRLDDAAVRRELCQVWGVGDWTVDFFLLRDLGRPDVFPAGDLGLRRAVGRLRGGETPSARACAEHARRWVPYRSTAAQYLLAWYYGLPE